MGRRAIFMVVLLGSLIAAGQLWLVSAMLSKQGADGRTGWERLSTATERKQERSRDMSIEGVSVIGCSPVLAGGLHPDDEPTAFIKLRVNGPSPGYDDWFEGELFLASGEQVIWINQVYSHGPFPDEQTLGIYTNSPSPVPSGHYAIMWVDVGSGGPEDGASTGLYLDVDTTVLPSFSASTSYECAEGGGVESWSVSAEVDYQPSSWNYELYDAPNATGNRIYAGSVNSPPSPVECSATMSVTGIPGTAKSIKLIATNANGTASTVVNLAASYPDPAGLSFTAEPTGILEG